MASPKATHLPAQLPANGFDIRILRPFSPLRMSFPESTPSPRDVIGREPPAPASEAPGTPFDTLA
jgi:hypothetical protein